MSYQVYQFEAVSIQEYVLAGGKLKTMVGASELLEAITSDLLDKTMKALALTEKAINELPDKGELKLLDNEVVFPRRAGSVFLMVLQNKAKAQQFAELWPILVANFAPGLSFSAAMKIDENFAVASKAVRDELNIQKNQPQTSLPESTPITVRFQKTGLAQIQNPVNNKSGLDWTMLAKTTHQYETLGNKHLQQDKQGRFVFPKQFEHTHADAYWLESFPFISTDPGNHSVAIIHTDGNGLGGYLHKLFAKLKEVTPAESIRAYSAFSLGLDAATQQAAQKATDWLISAYEDEDNPFKKRVKGEVLPLPMRPIILGGDDLTCIVRADYALGFVNAFTHEFEAATQQFVQNLPKVFDGILPKTLTCTTGLLFLKSNQPFSLGYALAEELCSAAKKVGQKLNTEMPPSLINFLHTTNTLFDSLETQLKQELETSPKQSLSRMPYSFSLQQERSSLQQLFELQQNFDDKKTDKLNSSAVRRYATHLHQDPAYANVFWNRWEKQSSEKGSPTEKTWADFNQQWSELETEITVDGKLVTQLPVADLIALFALNIKNPYQINKGAQ